MMKHHLIRDAVAKITVSFLGHPWFPGGMTYNIFVVAVMFFFLYTFLKLYKKSIFWKIMSIPMFIVFFFYFPNSTYLGMEFKHFFIGDGAANLFSHGQNLGGSARWCAFGIFSLISLVGFLSYFRATHLVAQLIRKSSLRAFWLTFASLAGAFGFGFGHLRLSTLDGLTNPLAIARVFIDLINTQWIMEWVAFLFLFQVFGSLLVDCIWNNQK